VIGLTPDKASGSNWLDLSTKTATCIGTALVDLNYGTIAPGSSRAFFGCFRH
ncbi:hypothetical protein QR685DRAFT_451900, partial [Neurospora intermedia]